MLMRGFVKVLFMVWTLLALASTAYGMVGQMDIR
jgi:hypothetical protein